jgi:hypothetical protein
MTPLLATTLVRDQHFRSFQVHLALSGGWKAWQRVDRQVVERQRHTDWQRVEQTLARFAREIDDLVEQGWRDAHRLSKTAARPPADTDIT